MYKSQNVTVKLKTMYVRYVPIQSLLTRDRHSMLAMRLAQLFWNVESRIENNSGYHCTDRQRQDTMDTYCTLRAVSHGFKTGGGAVFQGIALNQIQFVAIFTLFTT